MTFLPARLATWRYQRGLRSLTDTLSSFTQHNREIMEDVVETTPSVDQDVIHKAPTQCVCVCVCVLCVVGGE